MNKLSVILIIAFIMQLMECTLFAQTVVTPRYSSVEANTFSAGNVALFESQATAYIAARGWNNDVSKTGNATGTYNCHSYAWYMSEGGTGTYWINAATKANLQSFDMYNQNTKLPGTSNIGKYMEDGSYIEVPENMATKVFYGTCWTWVYDWGYNIRYWENTCDHSAVIIKSGVNAGKYESKWGSWGRYIHPADKSPYNITNRTFYMKAPNINGPKELLCNNNASYSLSLAPTSVTWDVTSGLTIVSGQGTNNLTVRIDPNAVLGSENGTIQAAAVYYGKKSFYSLPVKVDALKVVDVWANTYTTAVNNTIHFTAAPHVAANFEWRVSGGSYIEWPSGNYNSVTFYNTGTYYVECRINSACGNNHWKGVYVEVN
jgi:hypothetical protein